MFTLLKPGDRVGGHRIVHLLDTGDFCEVHAAIGPTGADCVIKLVAVDPGQAPKVHARAVQECVALGRIAHPGVVRCHAVGVWCERVWLALDLVPGDTLRRLLAAPGGRPPLADVVDWIAQAADAVAEAHRVMIVHRALTPDNILVAEGNVVKVIDFILAKLGDLGVKTTQDQTVGIARYMAPEQACGAPAHPCMDVYSLGCVLYEAITGTHPSGPGDRTLIATIDWHLREQPVPLLARVPDAPPALAGLVHRALDKVPARRPTMRELIDGLRGVVTALRSLPPCALSQLPLPGRVAALTRAAFFDVSAILASAPAAPGAPAAIEGIRPWTPGDDGELARRADGSPGPAAPATVTPLLPAEPPVTIRSATDPAPPAPLLRSGTRG